MSTNHFVQSKGDASMECLMSAYSYVKTMCYLSIPCPTMTKKYLQTMPDAGSPRVTTRKYPLDDSATLWSQHDVLDISKVLYKPFDFIT